MGAVYRILTKHLLCIVISVETNIVVCIAVHHFHGITYEYSALAFVVAALQISSAQQCKSRLSQSNAVRNT